MMTIPSTPHKQIKKEGHFNVYRGGRNKEKAAGQRFQWQQALCFALHSCPLLGIGKLYKGSAVAFCRVGSIQSRRGGTLTRCSCLIPQACPRENIYGRLWFKNFLYLSANISSLQLTAL